MKIFENERIVKILVGGTISLGLGFLAKIPAEALSNLTEKHIIEPLTTKIVGYVASRKS